jgi:hypothetical protein
VTDILKRPRVAAGFTWPTAPAAPAQDRRGRARPAAPARATRPQAQVLSAVAIGSRGPLEMDSLTCQRAVHEQGVQVRPSDRSSRAVTRIRPQMLAYATSLSRFGSVHDGCQLVPEVDRLKTSP